MKRQSRQTDKSKRAEKLKNVKRNKNRTNVKQEIISRDYVI